MIRHLGLGVATLCWSLVVFSTALRFHFDSDTAIDWLRWQVQDSSDGQYAIEIGDANPWRLLGIELTDLDVYSVERARGRRARTNEDGTHNATITQIGALPNIAVAMRPASFLRGDMAVDYRAELFGGTFGGSASSSQEIFSVDIDTKNINLSQVPLTTPDWTVQAEGDLELDVDLELDFDTIENSTGAITLEIEDFVINTAQFAGFDVDEVATFSESILQMEANEGRLDVTKGTLSSDLIDVTISGHIDLAKTVRRIRLRLDIDFTLNDEYDLFAKSMPGLKDARDSDGVYHYKLTGTLKNPRFRVASQGASGRGSRGSRNSRGQDRVYRQPRELRQNRDADQPTRDNRRTRDVQLSHDEVQERRSGQLERLEQRMRRGPPGGGAAPSRVQNLGLPRRGDVQEREIYDGGMDEPLDDLEYDDIDGTFDDEDLPEPDMLDDEFEE